MRKRFPAPGQLGIIKTNYKPVFGKVFCTINNNEVIDVLFSNIVPVAGDGMSFIFLEYIVGIIFETMFVCFNLIE